MRERVQQSVLPPFPYRPPPAPCCEPLQSNPLRCRHNREAPVSAISRSIGTALPLRLVQHELSTTRQRFGCRGHTCVEPELSGILVAGAHRLLRQRLDRRACTRVSGWRACFWRAQTPSAFKDPDSRTRNRRRGTQLKIVAHAHDTVQSPSGARGTPRLGSFDSWRYRPMVGS